MDDGFAVGTIAESADSEGIGNGNARGANVIGDVFERNAERRELILDSAKLIFGVLDLGY